MSIKYRTRGFVFAKEERMDADRVFSVFTKDLGRLELYGRAIRKINSKLKSGVDLFYLSEVEFIQGKNRKTLTDALVVKKFDNIFADLEKVKIAGQIAEVVNDLIRGQEKDDLAFELVADIFEKLNCLKNKRTLGIIFYYFLWNFLAYQGYKPEADVCGVCKKRLSPGRLRFSPKEGGVVCPNCPADDFSRDISQDAIKILRVILRQDWDLFSRLKISYDTEVMIKDISDNYYSYVLPGRSFNASQKNKKP